MQPVQRRITETALYLVVICELSIHGISKSRSAHGGTTMLLPAQLCLTAQCAHPSTLGMLCTQLEIAGQLGWTIRF